ncbi:unnamed protein product [Choristocarpus tenellus]
MNAPEVGAPPRPFKCSLVTGVEVDNSSEVEGEVKRMDTTLVGGEVSHMHLLSCLERSSSPEAIERARNSCSRFRKTVAQILGITRPFSFS